MPKLDLDAVNAAAETGEDELGAYVRATLGDPGGLTQYGVAIETLMPGARSSDRHWHSRQDEFLWMIEGAAVVIEQAGEYGIAPGDAVCWPAASPTGTGSRTGRTGPARFLIVGMRTENDICTYPDLNRRLVNEGPDWRLVDDATGTILKQGTR